MGKGTVVRGTPVNHIGPTGAGNAEGRTPGMPAGYSGKTVADQYRGDGVGIATRLPPGSGTPYVDREGNVDESRRVVSHDRYGVSVGGDGVDLNKGAARGDATMFEGATPANAYTPNAAPSLDSPVPRQGPRFDPGFISADNKARLGSGNESGAKNGLVEGGGVMSK